MNVSGQIVDSKTISKGSTIAYFDIQTLYDGVYLVRLNNDKKY